MNPLLNKLHPYPFEKLAKLKADITPPSDLPHIALSIGEPKHTSPDFALSKIKDESIRFGQYPTTKGLVELREAMTNWLTRRFQLTTNTLSPEEHILPVNGTREALFAFAQVIVDPQKKPIVILPNPFYQIYEGAAFLAGAEPYYLNSDAENNYEPDFSSISDKDWERCQLIYLCSPNNPTGNVISLKTYQALIELSDRFDFVIASDECYSEIYPQEGNAPAGLLQACETLGRHDFKNCMVFHSLSKRSNLPGLRSGFVAGDSEIIKQFLSYRTYHGCAMPIPTQLASIDAWNDEKHVIENRTLYRHKFQQFADILSSTWSLQQPDAGFNFWAKTPIDDQLFAQQLFAKTNITVLPGSYLSRTLAGHNPGNGHVRMAMVAPVDQCIEAAERIKAFIDTL